MKEMFGPGVFNRIDFSVYCPHRDYPQAFEQKYKSDGSEWGKFWR